MIVVLYGQKDLPKRELGAVSVVTCQDASDGRVDGRTVLETIGPR